MIGWTGKLLLTISYVTVFPCGRRHPTTDELAGLSRYLPAAGLLLGMIQAAVWLVMAQLHVPPSLQAAALLVLAIVLTGAIHLDGLMDAADGIFSCRDQSRMLEIMRDSRVGNFGAIAGICVIVCRFAALTSLAMQPISPEVVCAVAVVPAWSRASEVLAIGCFSYARPEGMGKIWHDTTGRQDMFVAVLIPATVCVAVWLGLGLSLASAAGVVTILTGVAAALAINHKLGGHTGDTYGAVVEIAELGGLIFLSLIA